jgi:hypothetical protein
LIGNAVKAMPIATGEQQEDSGAEDAKEPAAKALGRKGGKRRAESMSPERRVEIARKAARSK